MLKKILVILIFEFIVIGCTTENKPFRDDVEPFYWDDEIECEQSDTNDCHDSLIERHLEFDLVYLEFTERGNVFDRKKLKKVLNYVSDLAQFDVAQPTKGITVVVFVHGWKHNAKADDGNVKSFRRLLRWAARAREISGGKEDQRLVGVYIGWRGLSLKFPENATYWDRKATAEQVGKGGVTEVLLRLEHEVIDDERPNRNTLLVTGHSFGGAIVLSALHEILLERVIEAKPVDQTSNCVSSHPFGHGVILLNPAIEANAILQLEELVAEKVVAPCFHESQSKLLHVISSSADGATVWPFYFGQLFGVNAQWKQTSFEREFCGSTVRFDEHELDTTTVGNYAPFHTGRLKWKRGVKNGSPWKYVSSDSSDKSCKESENKAGSKKVKSDQVPVYENDPLAFIYTDTKLISDHNDVFNVGISAYLSSIVAQSRYKRYLKNTSARTDNIPSQCISGTNEFEFGKCFDAYQKAFGMACLELNPEMSSHCILGKKER